MLIAKSAIPRQKEPNFGRPPPQYVDIPIEQLVITTRWGKEVLYAPQLQWSVRV
jgi:hypothetical protein